MIRVLFVCLGNICRSPTAEAIFRAKVSAAGLQDCFHIDSAGTGDWHVGKPPDARMQQAARQRDYDLSGLRARQISQEDLDEFDHLLVMDQANLHDVRALAKRPEQLEKIQLLLDYGQSLRDEVPDPYYGGEAGFYQVIDLIEDATADLLQHLRQRHAV